MKMIFAKWHRLAFVVFTTFFGGSAQGQNLIENGSFEISRFIDPGNSQRTASSTQIDSWTIGGANAIFYVGTVATASDGVRSVQLQFVTANYIEQTIVTVPGVSYRVTFDASAYVGPNGEGARLMRGRATAREVGGEVIATHDFSYDGTGKRLPNVGWSSFSYDFTATTGTTTLRWESRETGNTGGPMVDHARVLPGRDDGAGNWIISGPPVFLTRMAETTPAVTGRPLRLAVTVLGDEPVSYQWYRVSNAGVYTLIAGANASSYEIASFANNQTGLYAVVASNSLASITNRSSVVRVSPPNIATQPDEQRLTVGQPLSFGPRSYSGGVPDTFQWFKDGVAIAGQTNANFTKASAEMSDTGIYHLNFSNIAGEGRSVDVPVTIFEGPVPPWIRFNQLPEVRNVQEGGFLSFNVGAEGAAPLSYLWYKDGEVVQTGNLNSYSKSNAQGVDSGLYYVVISNSVGQVTSAVSRATVYPPQEPVLFTASFVSTNVAEGASVTLTPTLTRGNHLVFQWYKRPLDQSQQSPGEPIPGATSLELTLPAISSSDAAQYTLVATNFVSQNQITFHVSVVAKPIFSMPVQSYEGPAGQLVQMFAAIENYTPGLTFQWLKDGEPIANATQSSYSFIASATTAGSYRVRARNEAGESTSNPAPVTLRDVTPANHQFQLVADYTIDVPSRPGTRFQVVGDAHLRNGVITFQSVTNHLDVGGLYRWEAGVRTKIVDLNDLMPGINAPISWYDGISAEEGALAHFIAKSTNATGNQMSVFEWRNNAPVPIMSQLSDAPGKPGVRFKTFGYPARGGGKTAFLAMEEDDGSGGYRCVLVWDGASFQTWASSDIPLPAGDGIWWSNSSQLGFDGSTLAFWAVDKTGGEGTRNGIFMSVNAGPLRKIAFTGDAIPGGGTFSGFNSPPVVHDGKVLFLGHAGNFNSNYLLEFVDGTLRVVAKSGDAPSGGGALTSMQYGFDYLADGTILFTAAGPGQKQGIYAWRNGGITEWLTTLNSIDSRRLRFVSLYDADGMGTVIAASFDGNRFGLYTNVGGRPPAPTLGVQRTGAGLTLSWSGAGKLQSTSDLREWTTSNESSPVQAPFSASPVRYFRVVEP